MTWRDQIDSLLEADDALLLGDSVLGAYQLEAPYAQSVPRSPYHHSARQYQTLRTWYPSLSLWLELMYRRFHRQYRTLLASCVPPYTQSVLGIRSTSVGRCHPTPGQYRSLDRRSLGR